MSFIFSPVVKFFDCRLRHRWRLTLHSLFKVLHFERSYCIFIFQFQKFVWRQLSHWLHSSFFNHGLHVCTRVPLSHIHHILSPLFIKFVVDVRYFRLDYSFSSLEIWQRYVDSSCESSKSGFV